MEQKLSSGGTLIGRGIKVLRVIAGPLVKRTVSVMKQDLCDSISLAI